MLDENMESSPLSEEKFLILKEIQELNNERIRMDEE